MSKGEKWQSDDVLELLSHIQSGSSGAFVKLAEKYAPLLESEVSRYVGSLGNADLEDLRQGALVSLYRAALAYRADGGVTFGLFAKVCIVNGIADTLRYIGKKSVDISMDEIPEDELCCEDDPEDRVLDRDELKNIRKKMALVLSDFELEIFELYLAGFSYAEIAEMCGRTVKSVDNALRRVKDKLKKEF